MLEELTKGLWKRNGQLSRATSNAYLALLQDEKPAPTKYQSWRMEEVLVKEQFGFQGLSRHFSNWGSQGHGLRRSLYSVQLQQWNSPIFSRSLATLKGKVDRRKRDLARREFQLLRRKTKLLKATLSLEEKLLWRLKKANRKRAVLLQRLKKYELEEDPEPVHDPELITAEQHEALKKIGYKNRNYVPVGRRGVYGGVVQNMHMHWKFHETVQIDCHIFKREDVRTVAKQLALLSGGIVIDIHQATNIIMYRGRNYKQPKKEMIPPNTLTKRKALFKSKFLQSLEMIEEHIKNMEGELQVVRRKQKQSAEQGAASGDSKSVRLASNQVEKKELLAGLSEFPSDDLDDEDDGLFSWETDSLGEGESSDGESVNDKANEVQEELTKPSSSISAAQAGKKKRLSAKELILMEQDLFENRRRADKAKELIQAEQELFGNKKAMNRPDKVGGSMSVQSERSIISKRGDLDEGAEADDEDSDTTEKGPCVDYSNHYGLLSSQEDMEDDIRKTNVGDTQKGRDKPKKDNRIYTIGLWSSEEDSEEDDVKSNVAAGQQKGGEQTKKMKIPQSFEGFETNTEEESDDLGSYIAGHNQVKPSTQIQNKKIAQFMESFISDSEAEKEQLGSEFDDLN